jgi:translation elongation factor EF-1alpha
MLGHLLHLVGDVDLRTLEKFEKETTEMGQE